ncbi:MAG: 2-amino-4-hydroxy-6-hydroxymethyldihydropteridine diphosphokinase [Aquificaceae bacterium]
MACTKIYLALGSNLGDRINYIIQAIDALSSFLKLKKVSTVYKNPPWGITSQPEFLNCVAEFETTLPPFELLKALKELEKSLGRIERERWGPREIDIDILLYGETVVNHEELKIPHPYLNSRDFFLIPLVEISEDLYHPVSKKPLKSYIDKNSLCEPFACIYQRSSLRFV